MEILGHADTYQSHEIIGEHKPQCHKPVVKKYDVLIKVFPSNVTIATPLALVLIKTDWIPLKL